MSLIEAQAEQNDLENVVGVRDAGLRRDAARRCPPGVSRAGCRGAVLEKLLGLEMLCAGTRSGGASATRS